MPVDYPVSQLMADVMLVIKDNMEYIIPVALLVATVAFVIRWFMYVVNIADWTFGNRR